MDKLDLPKKFSLGKTEEGTELFLEIYEETQGVLSPNSTVSYVAERGQYQTASRNPPGAIDFGQFNLSSSLLTSKIWVYNVSFVDHIKQHPVLGKNIKVPARLKGADYAVAFSIPNIIRQPKTNVDTSETFLFLEDGKRIAMDFINPDNLGVDQSIECSLSMSTSAGTNNLGKRGVFWSVTNPPSALEVYQAVRRMEDEYNVVLDRLFTLEMSDPDFWKRYSKQHITPEAHAAANYFNREFSWHKARQEK